MHQGTFQRLMDRLVTPIKNIVSVFLDDMNVHTAGNDKNKVQLHARALKELQTSLTYVDHIISKEGIKPDPPEVRCQ